MLQSYSMSGFKSVKNNVKIDLKSTNYKILSKSNVSNIGILKGALFVGETGAGKSTMVHSVSLLLDLLFNESEIDLRNYFCLTNKDAKHIKLAYEFYIRRAHVKYEIDIEYAKPLLVIEKLYVDNDLLIDRMGTNGRYANGDNPVHASNIEANRIFLRDLYESNFLNGNKVLFELMGFLRNSCYYNPIDGKLVAYNEAVNSRSLSTIEEQVTNINKLFKDLKMDMALVIRSDADKVSLRFKRGNEVALPIAMESSGIKNLIRFLPAFIHVMNKGGILIIDEFGTMHPTLESKLVGYFEEHTQYGQLLITTNNTNILSANVLRADQLYNVMMKDSSSEVIRFSSKQPRELQNMEKMYFNGIFSSAD